MVNGDLASVAKTGMCTYNRVVAPTSTRGSMLECVYVRTHCVEHLKDAAILVRQPASLFAARSPAMPRRSSCPNTEQDV